MSYSQLQGKVALITGATGGIGNAVSRALYAEGATLVLTDFTKDALDTFAEDFDPSRVYPLVLDVRSRAETQSVVDMAIARFDRIDIVFANTGIALDPVSTMVGTDPAMFKKVIDVDFMGVWHTIKASLPAIIDAKGYILITASIYSFMNGVANAPYAASKAAVESLSQSLRVELSGSGARVGALYPGWVATPIVKDAFGGNPSATALVKYTFRGPLGKPIDPNQLALQVVKGIQTRAARIIVPKFWVPMSQLRGLLNPLIDAFLSRDKTVRQLLRDIEKNQTLIKKMNKETA